MSEPSLLPTAEPDPDPAPRKGGRRAARRRRSGCIPILIVLAIFVVLGVFFVPKAIDSVKDMFAGPEDYPGPGKGEVTVVITSGQTIRGMGDALADLDVVASSDAFVDAASANPDATGIQAGTYVMKLKMAAKDAVAYLANPKNAGAGNTITVTEGARVRDVVSTIVSKTDFKKKELTKLLANPKRIGLPAEADGNPEGYLYPATYELTDKTTARSLLTDMVAQTAKAEKELKIAAGAKKLGLTVHEIMTVASILQYEANRGPDYPKVARVIYNRLDIDMPLQLDSTVSYVSKRKGDVWTTQAERENDSLYNTYEHKGLPPGPIGSPGKETIEAALNPAKGPWLYFVPDFENGKTLFTDDYQEHLANVEKAKEYCRTHDEC